MSRFDWKTDADDDWQTTAPAETRPLKLTWRSWVFAAIVVIILALIGRGVSRQIEERVETATANVTIDLLSSVNLMRTAILTDDGEIFRSLLSGRDPAWTEAQQSRFDQGVILGREFIGLTPLMDASALSKLSAEDPAISRIEYSPQLTEAVVVIEHPYRLPGGDQQEGQIRLRQTSVFRKGGQRWLLAPPLGDFWGQRVRQEGNRFILDYPERDGATAQRLATDIDLKLDEMCRTLPALDCPPDFRIAVRLTTSAGSVLDAAEPDRTTNQDPSLQLPAVTLIGIPIDEPGYQALFRGYASRVLSAAIATLVEWECCPRALIFGALTEYELAQLGLGKWPVTTDSYERVVAEGLRLVDLARYWASRGTSRLSGPEGWKVYTLIDFLTNRFSEMPVPEMQRLLTVKSSWSGWLAALDGHNSFVDRDQLILALEEDWWQYAADRVASLENSPPIPFPSQRLSLICEEATSSRRVLRQYSFAGQVWSEMALSPGMTVAAMPFASDDGILVSSLSFDEEEDVENWQTAVWRPGQGELPLNLDGFTVSLAQMDPRDRYLAVYSVAQEGTDPVPLMIDLTRCLDGDCLLLPLPGTSLWSPDGRSIISVASESLGQSALVAGTRTFLMGGPEQPEGWLLWRADIDAGADAGLSDARLIGRGVSPFWLGNDRYGYVRTAAGEGSGSFQEVMIAATADDVPRSAVRREELNVTSVRAAEGTVPTIRHVSASPAYVDRIFVLLDKPDAQAEVVSYELDTHVAKLLFHADIGNGSSIGYSPDGQWLLMTSFSASENGTALASGTLLLHRIGDGETRELAIQLPEVLFPANYDWSADGGWLAVASSERGVVLHAPAFGFRQVLIREPGDCPVIAWTNQGE
jgi:hypothetical protein